MFDTLTPTKHPGDPRFAALSDDALEDRLIDLASHIAAAMCQFLDLVAELERREVHFAWECRTAAHWLSLRCSIALGTAFEHLRVARALRDLPRIHDAFSRGELSYTKVRALSRVANSANEEGLLHIARRATGAQLDRIVAAFAGAKEAADPTLEAARHSTRYLRYRFSEDGSLTGSFCLDPEAGATLVAALRHAGESVEAPTDAAAEQPSNDSPAGESAELPFVVAGGSGTGYSPAGESASHRTDPWSDCDDPTGAANADALTHIASTALARTCPPGDSEIVYPRPDVIVHLGVSESSLQGGPQLSGAAALRLACDATAMRTATQSAGGLDLGRRRRVVSPMLRRALQARDKGCRFPGCHRRRHTHAHHIRHWAHGGPTDMDNLVLLCTWHHHRLHEGGCTIARAPN